MRYFLNVKYFGIEGNFHGTQIRALLRPSKFSHLLQMSTPTPPETPNPHSALFIKTYIALKDVIDSIFGNNLADDWLIVQLIGSNPMVYAAF